jgi:addiction module RelB/DinJ family antitoxin
MATADTYVRARIDSATKERAADALAAMGLSISDAIRLLMLRVAGFPYQTYLKGLLHQALERERKAG